jgi:hypothetical protein
MRKRSSSEFVITPLGILQVDDLAETHGGDGDDVVHPPDPVTRWTPARTPEKRAPKN